MTDRPIILTRAHRGIDEGKKELSFIPEFSTNDFISSEYRRTAWEKYISLPFPTGNEDDWRRTSLEELDLRNFHESKIANSGILEFPSKLIEPMADQLHGGQVLVSPAGSRTSLSDDLVKSGVIFTDLRTALLKHPDLMKKVLKKIDLNKLGKFAALSAALNFQGVFLYVPKNISVPAPLQSLFWVENGKSLNASHVFIYLDEGSTVTFVHESSSSDGAESLMHTGYMDVYIGQRAKLTFVELQSWDENAWNFCTENVVVDVDGSVDWIFGALGSRLTKNYSNLNLVGSGATGKMSGFYFTDNMQHLDHDTQQNHLAPSTTSDLLFKGALLGKSRSVWQGMIYVAPEASKTDGYQANRNLVLSKNARADSIPGLEILTDDVRCTHGATVGKVDEDLVFYLQSRGLDRKTAERLIVEGFFDPIMQRIPFEGVRRRFQNAIMEKMEHIV